VEHGETSLMALETGQAAEAVRRLFAESGPALAEAGERLRRLDPPVIATLARGSSDHACLLFKYAAEIALGRPVASLGPSVASVYGAGWRLDGAAVVAVSQSGRSPDLVAGLAAAREGGGFAIALVNDAASPLAEAADLVIDIRAGPERSVAATKSFVASAAAALGLVAHMAGDRPLVAALAGLPDHLDAALELDWGGAREALAAPSLFTLGRGPAFGIASEAALKVKEIVGGHAEALSGAEVMHGPLALVGSGFPVIAFMPEDASFAPMEAVMERIAGTGAPVFRATPADAARRLPSVRTGHAATDALAMILPFYRLVEATARTRGLDPDRPEKLSKVTRTV